jgi:hypothetical protein
VSSRVRSIVVLVGLLTLIGTAALRFGGASDAAVSSTLHASVGPGFDISLTFDDGTAVTALPPGPYRVLVSDVASDHNFHLYGPGVDQETQVDFTGSTTWNVTFRADSRYQFVCDPHADSMFGRFDAGTVVDSTPAGGGGGGGSGGGGSSGGKSTPVSSTPVLGTVLAGLSSAGKVNLTLKGKAVKTLAAGRYKLVVTDGSKKSPVAIRRTGAAANTLTGLSFVGSKTITLTLGPGEWTLYSSPGGMVSFRVTKG